MPSRWLVGVRSITSRVTDVMYGTMMIARIMPADNTPSPKVGPLKSGMKLK